MQVVPRKKETPVQRLEKLKAAAIASRQPSERDAWLNLAFYLDEQYVTWNEKSNTIQRIPRSDRAPNAPRPVVNKIMHFVQQEKAMVLQAKPTVDVLPATDDTMDLTDTAVGKAYCEYVADPGRAAFDRQLARATLWAIICGDGYLKWVWNPSTKQVDIIPVSIFELWTDPYATDFGKCRYVGHSKFMDIEQVYEAFGVELNAVKEEQADPTKAGLLRGMGAAPVVTGVTINELWYRPCKRFPQGQYQVWGGGRLLNEPDAPLPYKHLIEHRKLPFTQIGCIERPDSQHFMSPVKYLRSAQMELNKYHAQRIMIRESFANPKWWVPSELDLETMPDDSPRQILRGDSMSGTLRPEIIQPATYPPNDDGAMIESQMMHIVGLHEVSQGQVPGRVEAAKAIELLKESDADRQATMLETINGSISEGFWQVLMLAKEFETEDTLLQTYSREGMPEVQEFKESKIKPGMRIRPTMGTGLARSRAARQDQLMNMWVNKIITDPALMAELMEVPIPSFAAPRALDMRLARNENLLMAKNQAVQANSWDEHDIHLREHNNFRKTQEFLTASVEVKQKFEFHCQQHEKLQDAQIQKQAAQMATLQAAGAPPEAAAAGAGGSAPAEGDPSATPPA